MGHPLQPGAVGDFIASGAFPPADGERLPRDQQAMTIGPTLTTPQGLATLHFHLLIKMKG
jgi:hypothetical protein